MALKVELITGADMIYKFLMMVKKLKVKWIKLDSYNSSTSAHRPIATLTPSNYKQRWHSKYNIKIQKEKEKKNHRVCKIASNSSVDWKEIYSPLLDFK